jgi:hypothetical protein
MISSIAPNSQLRPYRITQTDSVTLMNSWEQLEKAVERIFNHESSQMWYEQLHRLEC